MNIKTMLAPVTRVASRVGLQCKKYSPEILLGTGIVSIVGGAVLLCVETRKVDEILMNHTDAIYDIHRVEEMEDIEYSDKDKKLDLVKTYTRTGVEFVKLYAPGALLMGVGVTCILASYGIIHKRNVALMAAYEAVNRSYEALQDSIRKKYGEDALEDLKNDMFESVTVKDQDGNDVEATAGNPCVHSPYARFFDESSKWWVKDDNRNNSFVISVQNWANDKLHANGHLFLNEVYDALDIPRSKEGQVVGWVLNNPKGNGYVDFDVFDGSNERKRAFVNGFERSILLDFNVDGVIYDMI